MKVLDSNQAYWYVMGSLKVNTEVKICDNMRLEKLECYVPLKYEVKRVRGRQQETLVPAIRGLIFAHASENELKAYMERSRDGLFFRKSSYTNREERLIVDEKAMRAFIAFVADNQQDTTFYTPEEIEWREGELVRVTIGSNTYEGEIVRIKGKRKKQFALSIPNTVYASIQLTPELLESIERYSNETFLDEPSGKAERNIKHETLNIKHETLNIKTLNIKKEKDIDKRLKEDDRDDHRSKDLDGDKKLLFETAFRLLFVLSDELVSGQREYQVARKELERVMKRVAPYKGYTAATEGELALPMFMGAMVTGENTEAATERLRKAIDRLKDSSMLKFRMRFYLAKLTNDEVELAKIVETVKGWNQKLLQKKQEEFMREVGSIILTDD